MVNVTAERGGRRGLAGVPLSEAYPRFKVEHCAGGCNFEVDASEPLGVKLRRLRKERGLSLTDFAEQVGVSRPTVWSWETGKTKPRRQKLQAVAETLNLLGDELILNFAEVEERTKARSLEREIKAAKARIAKIAGTSPDAVDITIRW